MPAGTGLSAAAGEGGPGELLAALEQVPLLPRRHAWLKFAVRGPVTPDAGEGMTAATTYLAGRPDHPRLVLGRYADESLDDVEEWIELAARAGYDPRAAITLWQKMAKLGGGSQPEWLSTHPSHETRLKDLEVYAQKVMPLYQAASR